MPVASPPPTSQTPPRMEQRYPSSGIPNRRTPSVSDAVKKLEARATGTPTPPLSRSTSRSAIPSRVVSTPINRSSPGSPRREPARAVSGTGAGPSRPEARGGDGASSSTAAKQRGIGMGVPSSLGDHTGGRRASDTPAARPRGPRTSFTSSTRPFPQSISAPRNLSSSATSHEPPPTHPSPLPALLVSPPLAPPLAARPQHHPPRPLILPPPHRGAPP
ncbi:hypothetical protein IAT38_008377 [Cryptococcus sp. DSM 104549]